MKFAIDANQELLAQVMRRVTLQTTEHELRSYISYWSKQPWVTVGDDTEESLLEKITQALNERRIYEISDEDMMKRGVLPRWAHCSLAGYTGLETCERKSGLKANEWPHARDDDGRWTHVAKTLIVIGGHVGSGKTHLATAIMRRCMEAGLWCKWADVETFFAKLKKCFAANDGSGEEMINSLQKPTLLVLDDVVFEDLTPYDRRIFSRIIRYRYAHMLPTIATTNNPPHVIHKDDPRGGSRIFGEDAIVIHLAGKDRRKPQGVK